MTWLRRLRWPRVGDRPVHVRRTARAQMVDGEHHRRKVKQPFSGLAEWDDKSAPHQFSSPLFMLEADKEVGGNGKD